MYGTVTKPLECLVMPVSGGDFVNQSSVLHDMCSGGYKPDVMMSSSGGNIVSYIGLASGFIPERLCSIMRRIESSDYTGKTNLLKMCYNFLTKQHLYDIPDPLLFLGEYLTNSEVVTRTEIWTGITDICDGKPVVYCNKKRENSILKLYSSESLEVNYLDGNMEKISKIIASSASIPFMTNEVDLENRRFVDGGLAAASPMCLLKSQISLMEYFHIVYIVGSDIHNTRVETVGILPKLNACIKFLVCNSIRRDRDSALSLLGDHTSVELDAKNWYSEYLGKRNDHKRTVLEITSGNKGVDITKFSKQELEKKFWKNKSGNRYILHYSD